MTGHGRGMWKITGHFGDAGDVPKMNGNLRKKTGSFEVSFVEFHWRFAPDNMTGKLGFFGTIFDGEKRVRLNKSSYPKSWFWWWRNTMLERTSNQQQQGQQQQQQQQIQIQGRIPTFKKLVTNASWPPSGMTINVISWTTWRIPSIFTCSSTGMKNHEIPWWVKQQETPETQQSAQHLKKSLKF